MEMSRTLQEYFENAVARVIHLMGGRSIRIVKSVPDVIDCD